MVLCDFRLPQIKSYARDFVSRPIRTNKYIALH